MELHEVQPYVAARIAAVPTLAAFGAALQFSEFDDEQTVENTIAERLRTVGVCIMVSDAEFDRTSSRQVRGVAGDASFVVFVAESLTVTHTPTNKALLKAILTAIQAQVDNHTPRAEIQSTDTAKDEHGYVLRVLQFKIPVIVP